MTAAAATPWPHGKCEAGSGWTGTAARLLPPCDRRGRWLVDGVVLCGTCLRALEQPKASA